MQLTDLGFVGRGKSKHRPRNDAALYGGAYPFVQTGDVKSADLWLRKYTQTYNELGLAQSKLWPKGTLCITIAANIAETAILGIDACFPDSIVGFIPNSTKADARYIKYYIDTIKLRMQNISGGTTQDNLSVEKLLSFDFAVPHVEVQKHVAGILSAYDDLIENNNGRIKILEQMAQMLYREWFVNFRFPSHEKVTTVESEVGAIPEGWTVASLGDMTSVVTKGTTPTTRGKSFVENGINFVKVESITESGSILPNKLARIDSETHELLKRSQLQENDILYSIAGAIGRVALVSRRILPANTNQALAIVRCLEPLLVPYILRVVSSREFLHFSNGHVVQTAQANVSLSVLKAAPVLLPPPALLATFNDHVRPIQDLLECLSAQTENLRATRDLLLPKLVSGEISVEQIERKAVAQMA